MSRGKETIRCLTTNDTMGDVITNEPECDAGNAVKDAGTLSRAGREGRSKLIDEVCEMCGYERKHAIKVLGGKLPVAGADRASRGDPRCRYGDAERHVLKVIWMASDQPCGKRLKALVELWLPHYEAERGKLEAGHRERVLSPSAATMDRLLAPCRVASGSRLRCGPRPESAMSRMEANRKWACQNNQNTQPA